MAFDKSSCPRLVIKVGSALLVNPDGTLREDWLASLVSDIAARHTGGQDVIIVSSGAIALGARKLGLPAGGRANLADAQAAASVGQITLSGMWGDLLARHKVEAAQILVTLDDLEDRRRYLNATATLDRLLQHRAIPVINENDSVATSEIRFGDNDRLAARVAQAANAQGVILLSDVDGLYDSNPARNPDAELISRVETIDDHILAMADDANASAMGSGGMSSKLEAAQIANLAGINLAIISGREDNPLHNYEQTARGTLFVATRQENARRSWLGGRLTVNGTIMIDDGAFAALSDGNSLLAAGATSCSGDFVRGDVVDILDANGNVVARGLSEYDASDCKLIMGHKTAELEVILGHAPRRALIHRDQMIIL